MSSLCIKILKVMIYNTSRDKGNKNSYDILHIKTIIFFVDNIFWNLKSVQISLEQNRIHKFKKIKNLTDV